MKQDHIRPLVIIGPSGAGKSTILQALSMRVPLHITPTWTDRPRRGNELELEHRFVSHSEFDEQKALGVFLQVVQPFELPYRYGFRPIEPAKSALPTVMIRAPFVTELMRYYPSAVVYQIESGTDFVELSLAVRGVESQGSRLSQYELELKLGRTLAQRIFTNNGRELAVICDELITRLHDDKLI